LIRNPAKRIGSNNVSEIKSHPFFARINWDDIINKKFIPPKFEDKAKDLKMKNYDYICNREIMEDIKQGVKNNTNHINGWSYIKEN
jgi:hypothetical protein